MIPHLYLLLAYEVAQRLFPKNIGDLYRGKAVAESGFFQGASRIQTHSEAIAALGGATRERQILEEKFGKVEGATLLLHRGLSKFGLIFKLAYTYGCRSWLTSFMMLPVLTATQAVCTSPARWACADACWMSAFLVVAAVAAAV